MSSQSKSMRLPTALCEAIDDHWRKEGLPSFAAAVADLVTKGLAGPEGAAVLDALPKASAPKVAKAPAQTKTPPPSDRARVSQIDGLQVGRVRPAYGSMLKTKR